MESLHALQDSSFFSESQVFEGHNGAASAYLIMSLESQGLENGIVVDWESTGLAQKGQKNGFSDSRIYQEAALPIGCTLLPRIRKARH